MASVSSSSNSRKRKLELAAVSPENQTQSNEPVAAEIAVKKRARNQETSNAAQNNKNGLELKYKKPSLNHEILCEIFIKAVIQKDKDPKTLTSFMLSGKLPFKVAQNYFRNQTDVKIDHPEIIVTFKNANFRNNVFTIKSDFPLLNALLPSIFSSIGTLQLGTTHKLLKGFKFNNGKVKTIIFQENCEIRKIIEKSLMNFESIEIVKGRKLDIPFLPKSCRELILKRFDLERFSKKNSRHLDFSRIKKLIINGEIDFNGSDFDNTIRIRALKCFIINNFPNLEILNINFGICLYCYANYPTNEYNKIFITKYKPFPSNVKGTIYFKDNKHCGYDYDKFRNDIKSYKFEETENAKIFKKEFEIHEGLVLKFSGFIKKR